MFRKPMPAPRPDELAPGGRLAPDAVERVPAEAVEKLLAEAREGPQRAAAAVAAGLRGASSAVPRLLGLLDDAGVAGRAAAWALGRLGGAEVEKTLREAAAGGGVVRRENAYSALASFAAQHKPAADLADFMAARVEAEMDRAKSGRTGLCDHALRVLAVLGDGRTEDLARRVIEVDRFANRVEIDRIRKAMARDRRDTETAALASGPWTKPFADDLVPPPEAAPRQSSILSPGAPAPAKAQTAPKGASKGAPPREPEPAPQEPPAPRELDWNDFLASPEAAALPARAKSMAVQLGRLLEQLATRAVGAPLGDLTGQEMAALLLQVLPQSLPPQSVQAALSPEALRAYEAAFLYMGRTGAATHPSELVDAVRLVRRQLREQVKRTGLLDGPDYSDPA